MASSRAGRRPRRQAGPQSFSTCEAGKGHPGGTMADTTALIESLEKLTVLEVNSLVKELEERWGVSAAAPVAMGVAPSAGGGGATAAAQEEKTEFDVVLTEAGANKIQ